MTLMSSSKLPLSSKHFSFLRVFVLHLGQDFLLELLELVLVTLLLRPVDTQAFLLVGLGNHVEVDVIHDLMSDAAVVLQDVVILSVYGLSDFLCDGQDLCELVVGDIVEFCAVVLGNDELGRVVRQRRKRSKQRTGLTAWP